MLLPKTFYSTNPLIKEIIQENYYNDCHYLWASGSLDNRNMGSNQPHQLTARSSNPADIYYELYEDTRTKDKHSAKIKDLRSSIIKRTREHEKQGIITDDQKEEIIILAKTKDFDLWKPRLYVIPAAPIATKAREATTKERASGGMEWIIEKLERNEFDIVDLTSCFKL